MASTHLKNISQTGSFPKIRVNIKNLWNHHLEQFKKKLDSTGSWIEKANKIHHCYQKLWSLALLASKDPSWWLNPFKTYARQIGSFPQMSGWNVRKKNVSCCTTWHQFFKSFHHPTHIIHDSPPVGLQQILRQSLEIGIFKSLCSTTLQVGFQHPLHDRYLRVSKKNLAFRLRCLGSKWSEVLFNKYHGIGPILPSLWVKLIIFRTKQSRFHLK